jgi:hypothetical protein
VSIDSFMHYNFISSPSYNPADKAGYQKVEEKGFHIIDVTQTAYFRSRVEMIFSSILCRESGVILCILPPLITLHR